MAIHQFTHHPFFQILLFSLLSVLSTPCRALSSNIRYEGLMCSEHPAAEPGWNPVLIRSWVLDRTATEFEQEAYIVGYTNHTYVPVVGPSSKYFGLDFFYVSDKRTNPTFRMYFHREVKVYMLVAVQGREFDHTKSASLLGWNSEGWARRRGSASDFKYGVHVKRTKRLAKLVYVFSKLSTDKYIDIPEAAFVQLRVTGINVRGLFTLLIAERDGKRSAPVGTFRGAPIRPNEACPAELHDTWVTVDKNSADVHTQGLKFSTWHPTWDPCHWCAYDHDHGSSPKHIFGYEPKYDYTALKNGNENEPHRGFKGFVFETKNHYVYYNLHVRTSSLRRVRGRFHSIHLVIADKTTSEVLVDIAHKGDFGFQSVRLKSGNAFRPISELDREIKANQTGFRQFRSIPVIDVDNLVPEYMYRNPVLLGVYEEWRTMPMCAKSTHPRRTVRAVFKQPSTGIKSVEESSTSIDLGLSVKGQFVKSPSMTRTLLLQSIQISDTFCPDGKNGYFYTDAFGRLADGPSETSLRQYVKPGFHVTLRGRYEPEEVWIGMHQDFRRGTFVDHGYGINPNEN